MRRLLRLAAAAWLLGLLAVPSVAQTLSPKDRLESAQYFALVNRIDSFNAAMEAGDMVQIMGVVPPKVLDKIATTYGVTTEQLVAATQEQFAEVMKTVTFVSFEMDLESATFFVLPSGTPYALIPTETVMDLGANGGKMRATASTLGLLDGDTWYLVRTEDGQQVQMLKEIYPEFADVEFPKGAMEPVTE